MWTTLLSGGLNLVGSALNAHLGQVSSNKEYERQLEFWNKQNEYNQPKAQRDRFLAAGMNPAAAAGEIATGQTAGQLSSVPSNEVMKNGVIDTGTLSESLKALAEIENIATNTESVSSDIALKALELIAKRFGIEGVQLDNAIKSLKRDRMFEENKYTADMMQAQLNEVFARTNKTNVEASDIQATQSSRIRSLETNSDDLVATRQSRIAKNIANANYLDAQAEINSMLSEAQYSLLNAQEYSERQRAANIYADTVLKGVEATYKQILSTNASNDEARKAGLYEFDKRIRELQAQGLIEDNKAKQLENRFREITDFGDFKNYKEFQMFFVDMLKDMIPLTK